MCYIALFVWGFDQATSMLVKSVFCHRAKPRLHTIPSIFHENDRTT